MTLTTRITSFFLGVLACVLVGFAVGLYLLADRYLHNGLAERLDSALNTLAAAADVNPENIEWEPASRSLTIGQDPSPDQVRWLVQDDRAREIDRSRNLTHDEELILGKASAAGERSIDGQRLAAVDGWRLLHKRIAAPGQSGKSSETGLNTYRALTVTVGIRLAPVESTLRTLGLALAGLSLALWSIAAIAGRWICRKALAPVTHMAGAARDMTVDDLQLRLPTLETGDELEELARAINGLLNRLEDSFERQRRFTGDASHQLRTPVTAMLGQLDVALTRQRSPDEYRQTLEAIRAQAQRLRQIVDSQLFLARADAEAFQPALEQLNLAKWLRDHLEGWRTNSRWNDFEFDMSADDRAIVRAHPQLLSQLVDNLIDNGVKYSPAGTPIQIAVAASDNLVECSVTNGGQPIGAEDLAHVFEPFFRSAASRRKGISGAGLGLAIAQRIAIALGGSIRADTTQNGQTQFVLQLPRTEVGELNHLPVLAISPLVPSGLLDRR